MLYHIVVYDFVCIHLQLIHKHTNIIINTTTTTTTTNNNNDDNNNTNTHHYCINKQMHK